MIGSENSCNFLNSQKQTATNRDLFTSFFPRSNQFPFFSSEFSLARSVSRFPLLWLASFTTKVLRLWQSISTLFICYISFVYQEFGNHVTSWKQSVVPRPSFNRKLPSGINSWRILTNGKKRCTGVRIGTNGSDFLLVQQRISFCFISS